MPIKTCPECGISVVVKHHAYGSGKHAPCAEHADAIEAAEPAWSPEDEDAADFVDLVLSDDEDADA